MRRGANSDQNREPGLNRDLCFCCGNRLQRKQNEEFQQWVADSWVSNKSPRVAKSSFPGEIQAVFYGFDMARMLEDLMAELLFGNIGVGIPTFARNDNSTVVYQVGSVNAVTNEKRLNNFLERNREELEKNNWLSMGYITGGNKRSRRTN